MSEYILQYGKYGVCTSKRQISISRVPYTLTLSTDGNGTLTATSLTGFPGDTVTLTPEYNTYYRFDDYTVTGGTVSENTFTFGSSNATVKANFKPNTFTVSGRFQYKATTTANRSVTHTFWAYATTYSTNVPDSFFTTKTSSIVGNKSGTASGSSSKVWNPSGPIKDYMFTATCKTNINQNYALSTNYLQTNTHGLFVNSTSFGTANGFTNGKTKATTIGTDSGSTTIIGPVYDYGKISTSNSYDYWTTNYSYGDNESSWSASGILP